MAEKSLPGTATRTLQVLLMPVLVLMMSACEELGPEAKGEIATTALQSVGDERACIPLGDMVSAQPMKEGQLRVLLRDGSDWRNDLRGTCPGIAAADSVVFVTETGDACVSDQIQLLLRSQSIARLAGTCTLGRFTRH